MSDFEVEDVDDIPYLPDPDAFAEMPWWKVFGWAIRIWLGTLACRAGFHQFVRLLPFCWRCLKGWPTWDDVPKRPFTGARA